MYFIVTLAFVVHPGLVKTNLFKEEPSSEVLIYSLGKWSKNALTGSLSALKACLIENSSGQLYYFDETTQNPSYLALDKKLQANLYHSTIAFLKFTPDIF